MTTTLEKYEKSAPWEDILYPQLRDPVHAKGYLDSCLEESEPGLLALAISQVITANKDLPFIAYQVICAYSHHLQVQDLPRITDTLKKEISKEHQIYLADLYWWLHILGERLEHSDSLVNVRVEIEPRNLPDNIKALPEYQQWANVA